MDKKETKKNNNKDVKKEDPFFYSYSTYSAMSDKKQAFLRASYNLDFYSMMSASKVACIDRSSVYNWITESKELYDRDFKNLLDEILAYKEDQRLEEENRIKAKIKRNALLKLDGVIEQIDITDISKPESPILIFANKSLNGLSETVNNKTEFSGGVTVKNSVANLSDNELDKELAELESQSEFNEV